MISISQDETAPSWPGVLWKRRGTSAMGFGLTVTGLSKVSCAMPEGPKLRPGFATQEEGLPRLAGLGGNGGASADWG